MSLILEAKNINKYFGKSDSFQVLKDCSLQIQRGEFASIMGKSGSGKSTLLYILSTMDTDYSGEVYLNNQLLAGQTEAQLAHIRNQHIGFIFQFHYLLPEFSVLENIMLPAKRLNIKPIEQINEEANEILKSLNIEHLGHKKASKISGGEKQRVAVARALINEPSILMGDEPTGNLDSYNAENLLNIFKSLKEERGLSLLIVTHDIDFANKTDRIILLEDGRIV